MNFSCFANDEFEADSCHIRIMVKYFSNGLYSFLKELAQNNNRDWFMDNKSRYEAQIKEPMLAFLDDLSKQLEDGYEVSSKSMLRQHRDTRFSKDKSPYKVSVACFMYSTKMKKSDRPHGYYLHLDNDESFSGAGVHSPPGPHLLKIRNRIVGHPKEWKAISKLQLTGESLKRAPKGFDPDHEYVSDLKRKDFIVMTKLTKAEVTSSEFLDTYLRHCRANRPLVDFLGNALG